MESKALADASGLSRDFRLIGDNDSLAACCDRWAERPLLALDTEFIRTDTFYPKVGLIQVDDGEETLLIDPLSIDDWTAFRRLMTAPGILKVFHSCSEDMLVFYAFLGVIPEPVFDTQLAAAFLDQGLSLSYQNLVRDKMGVDLPKGETRSDWLQRPLSEEQLRYAALDVAYLPAIQEAQQEQLAREGKLDWFREDCERSVRLYDNELAGDFSEQYRQIKGAWSLDRRQLGVLKRLAEWREQRARKRDRPRNWIVRDQPLLAFAGKLPDSKQELALIPEVSPKFIQFEGEAVLEVIRDALDASPEALPAPLPKPLDSAGKKRLKAAQQFVRDKAEGLAMSPDILARKRLLTALLYALEADAAGLRREGEARADDGEPLDLLRLGLPEELRGWRGELLLPDLLEVLRP